MEKNDKSFISQIFLNGCKDLFHEREEVIRITKAKEFCAETDIFSEHWMVIDTRATEIFSKIHSNK